LTHVILALIETNIGKVPESEGNESEHQRTKNKEQEISVAKNNFPYVDKWLSNNQSNHKLSSHF
jgi:hypothetical protein